MKTTHFKNYLPILFVLLCAAVVGALLLGGVIDLDTVPDLAADRPAMALLVIFALFVVKGFSGVVLYNPLVIAVSLIYDLPVALLINGVGTAVCLSISYAIGYRTKTDSLEERLEKYPKFKQYFSATRKYGFVSCFAIHLLGLSMEVLGILFGIMRIGFWRYLISSWLAIIPGMVCFTIAGAQLSLRSPAFWIVLGIDALMILFGILYTRKHFSQEKQSEVRQ